jgi:DNA polymerase elongation subunit (family B)
MEEKDKDGQIEGAYVKEPQVGMHDWVVSFDLNSLYPHLMMQYNISPDTLIDDMQKDISVNKLLTEEYPNETEYSLAANGFYFRKDFQGFLPELMEKMYNDRVYYKREMINAQKELESKKETADEKEKERLRNAVSKYNNIQMAKKISLNSAYGAIGNRYFRFFDLRLAEAITISGQLSIRWIEKKVNQYMNKLLGTDTDYVIAIDTDSIYVRMDELVKKFNPKSPVDFLNSVCEEKFERFICKSYEELANYMGAYDNKMVMAREVIADKGIWTAKKRYILNVHDSEGVRYSEPKLKMMGIEAVKSSTPYACRQMIKEALKIIMAGEESELHKFVEDSREKFKTMPFEDVAFPRGVKGLAKYSDPKTIYKSATPIHVRGALMYNFLLEEKNLSNKYPYIQEGEKIKFCYLKKPNRIGENVISILSSLPKELDLNKYIDYDTQFNKAFLEPLKVITEKIDWTVEHESTLESFFS